PRFSATRRHYRHLRLRKEPSAAWPADVTWSRARRSARACCCARPPRWTTARIFRAPGSCRRFPPATPGRTDWPCCAPRVSTRRRAPAPAKRHWKPSPRRKPPSNPPGIPRMPHDVPGIEDCAREPIHLSGAIQPHGYLVSCDPSDWTIRHVSANAEDLFGMPAGSLPGQSLCEHVADEILRAVSETAGFLEPGATGQRVGAANLGVHGTLCDLSAHLADGLLHLEAEPLGRYRADDTPTAVAQAMIARRASGDDDAFLESAAGQVRLLSGYDRVMVYRFREDDAGEVIAESLADGLEPYLG